MGECRAAGRLLGIGNGDDDDGREEQRKSLSPHRYRADRSFVEAALAAVADSVL